jgi:hypothetical protein
VRYDDPEEKKEKLTKELNNGRLAMLAIMGEMVRQMCFAVSAYILKLAVYRYRTSSLTSLSLGLLPKRNLFE